MLCGLVWVKMTGGQAGGYVLEAAGLRTRLCTQPGAGGTESGFFILTTIFLLQVTGGEHAAEDRVGSSVTSGFGPRPEWEMNREAACVCLNVLIYPGTKWIVGQSVGRLVLSNSCLRPKCRQGSHPCDGLSLSQATSRHVCVGHTNFGPLRGLAGDFSGASWTCIAHGCFPKACHCFRKVS